MSSQAPTSDRYPRFALARFPITGQDGAAYDTVMRFKFNPTQSGSGSNTQTIAATAVGTYTIGLLEPYHAYTCESIEVVADIPDGATITLLTRDPPATLATAFAGTSISAGQVYDPRVIATGGAASSQIVKLASATDVGSLSVRVSGDACTTGEINFFIRKVPIDSDMKHQGFATYSSAT